MKNVFTVDGVAYNVIVPRDGIKRKFEVLDGPNTGRSLLGDLTRDIIGTFYNYTIEIVTKQQSREEYDRLYEVLSSPKEYHEITVPYGQVTLTFKAYVTSGEDSISYISDEETCWDGLSVNFIAMSPQRRAYGN